MTDLIKVGNLVFPQDLNLVIIFDISINSFLAVIGFEGNFRGQVAFQIKGYYLSFMGNREITISQELRVAEIIGDLSIWPLNQHITDSFVSLMSYSLKERIRRFFKSNDFGDSWETINTPIPASKDVRNIYFYNENIGFLDGVADIYKTMDGGLNWEPVDFPFFTFDMFHFYNENEGFNIESVWAYEGGDWPTFKGSQVYQTSNGGAIWDKSGLVNGPGRSVFHTK